MPPQIAMRWDLGKLYSDHDDPRIDADLSAVKQQIADFKQTYEGRLADLDAAGLRRALEEMEAPSNQLERLAGFAWMNYYTDTSSDAARGHYHRMWTEYTLLLTEFEFFKQGLKYLPAERFEMALAAPELAPYRYYLERVRKWTPHTLPIDQENLLARRAITGEHAWSQLYTEMVTGFKFELDLPGDRREIGLAEARSLRTNGDRRLRRASHEGALQAHAKEAHVITHVFNTLQQDHLDMLHVRGLDDLMGPILLEHDLPRAVVDALMAATETHYALAQCYYRIKAKALGISDLSSWDLWAPFEGASRHVPFEEAQGLVLDAFQSFSPRFAKMAGRFFEERYIDPFPSEGKPSGAFCFGLGPTVHPYVFMNYGGTLYDATVLAHELGHGLHYLMAGAKQSLLNTYTVPPMLETVSIFAEMVTVERLLDRETDPRVRIQLLASQLEGGISMIMRQVMYTRWELAVYERRKQGTLTTEELGQLWMAENRKVYGKTVAFSEWDAYGWMTNPYFITQRFVNLSYAFGQLLVYALFQQYRDQGDAFVAKYMAMLELGGSAAPADMLATLGVNIADPTFWNQGFSVMVGMLSQLEASVAQLKTASA